MSCNVRYVKGDYGPPLVAALTYKSDGRPLDVSASDVTVRLRFWKNGAPDTILQNIIGTKMTGAVAPDGTIDTTYTVPGSGGRVQFIWPLGALDVDAGLYEADITVEITPGQTWSVYDRIRITIREHN